jgi:ligand-binding sensor domain-containing protein
MKQLAALVLALAGCSSGTGVPGGAPLPTGSFRAEDLVVLGDFSAVQAIATSFERVYVAFPSAVAMWDQVRDRWEVPQQAPTPMALARVRHAIVDPLDQSLWLGGDDGVIHFDPVMQRWERLAVGGRVTRLAIDRANPAGGIWIATSDGWLVVRRGEFAPSPAPPPNTLQSPPDLETAYREIPMLRASGQIISLGPGLTPGRITAVGRLQTQGDWLIGTDRAGLLRIDPFSVEPRRMTPGLPGEMVGALAAVPGGVWVATDQELSRGVPAALSFVPDELGGTDVRHGDPAMGLGFSAVRRILPGNRVLWLASDRGLVEYGIDDNETRYWGEANGLRDQRTIAVANWQGQLMVGTMRGVALLDDDGDVSLPVPNLIDPVYALFALRDTMWIGSGVGLAMLVRGDSGIVAAPGWRGTSPTFRPVIGIGLLADTLVAMTRELVVRRDPVTGEWILGAPTSSITGLLRAFHATEYGAWIGGDRGAAFVTPSGAPLHSLLVGRELPGPVTSITSSPGLLWVGTTRGLVRLVLRD